MLYLGYLPRQAMPFADLLGVQLDMHMLGKLTASVAAILLVSWAYKFYNSRRGAQREQVGPSNGQTSFTSEASGLCSNCQAEIQTQNKASPEGTNGNKLSKQGDSSTKDDVLYDGLSAQMEIDKESPVKHPIQTAKEERETTNSVKQQDTSVDKLISPAKENTAQKVFEPLNILDLKKAKEEAMETLRKEGVMFVKGCNLSRTSHELPLSPKEKADEFGKGCRLSPPSTERSRSPIEHSQVIPTDRPRSPCLLRKLEPSTEVGRELRQDLGCPGSFSTFQSKAAVIVDDGDLLLERPGDRFVEVRGKIYDYYVESSSESISNGEKRASVSTSGADRIVKDGNISRDSQLTQVNRRSSSSSELTSLSTPVSSPLIMRDLVFPPDSRTDSPTPINRSPSPFRTSQLIRKDSYQHITENSELQIPLSFPRVPTPLGSMYGSQSASSENLSSNPGSPTEDPATLSESIEPSLERIAGINFLQMPIDNSGIAELENLQGKLDLGNCLQVLSLARKYNHITLQEAALKVMSDNYFQVLRDSELYGKLKAGDRDQIQKQRMKGKQYLTVADIDPQDCNRSQSFDLDHPRMSSKIYYYDDYRDTWHTLCALPREVVSKGCAMCTMDNYIFIAVGCESTDKNVRPSRRVFCYNPVTSIWKEICPMNEARPQCKLVALQGYVYAIGGECLSTVERYDPRVDRWSYVAPLPNDTFAVAHRATACHGELFVSGGTLRYTLLRYNPKTNVWRQSLIVGSKERTTEMVAVRNFLYRFDISPLLGISVYRYHTVARLWYECCSRRFSDCLSFQCTVLGDVIYCINRQFNMRFLADEVSPTFVAEDLHVLSAAKGMLFPFVLALPDKETLQTRV